MGRLGLCFCVAVSLLSIPATAQHAGANDRVDAILRDWQASTSRIRHLECSFSLFRYDPVFEIEKRGTGSLAVDTQGRAFYKVGPVTIDKSEKSRHRSKDGYPYDLQTVLPERWYWTQTSTLQIDDSDRVVIEWMRPDSATSGEFQPEPPALPEDDDTEAAGREVAVASDLPDTLEKQRNPSDRATTHHSLCEAVVGYVVLVAVVAALPLADFDAALQSVYEEFPMARPFLLGMPIADLKQRFHISLLMETATEVHLRFVPTKKNACQFDQAEMILRVADWMPVALKQVDGTGTITVHVFQDVRINPNGISCPDPFSPPNLKGYRRRAD